MMATRLTLIAQGATAASRLAAFPANESLCPDALDGMSVPPLWRGAHVRISPMIAAVQTAQGLGLTGDVDEALTDASSGEWTGQTIAAIGASHPAELVQWITDPGFDSHGGESRTALRDRAQQFLRSCALAKAHTVAITHVAVIRALMIEVLEAPDAAFWKLDVAPLTLSDLRHDGRRWALRQMGMRLAQKKAA
jgi:broad specificity phosphatase PhoE